MPEIGWLQEDDCAKGLNPQGGPAWRRTSRSKSQGVCVRGKHYAKRKQYSRKAARPQGKGGNSPQVTHARPEANAIYTGPGGSRPTGWWSARNRWWSTPSGESRVGMKVHSSLALAGSHRSVPQYSPAGGWRQGRATDLEDSGVKPWLPCQTPKLPPP